MTDKVPTFSAPERPLQTAGPVRFSLYELRCVAVASTVVGFAVGCVFVCAVLTFLYPATDKSVDKQQSSNRVSSSTAGAWSERPAPASLLPSYLTLRRGDPCSSLLGTARQAGLQPALSCAWASPARLEGDAAPLQDNF